MLDLLKSRVLWGSLIVLAGLIFLLQGLGLIRAGNLIWALLFGLGGVIFLGVYLQNREQWWSIIPAVSLIAIGLFFLLEFITPETTTDWGGTIILGGIGLSFVLIYLLNIHNWWAIIPGGVLLTLAAVAGLDQFAPELETGGLFLLGLGITFSLVAILPSPDGPMRWAWIPAAILVFLGLALLLANGQVWVIAVSIALVLIGGFLILRAIRKG